MRITFATLTDERFPFAIGVALKSWRCVTNLITWDSFKKDICGNIESSYRRHVGAFTFKDQSESIGIVFLFSTESDIINFKLSLDSSIITITEKEFYHFHPLVG
ncbi:MAG: hypothetical protein HC836_40890 [Richelia sp. RM2_1_2]|nr:hypothetical protein [Richelia sp. RM2_1_2]